MSAKKNVKPSVTTKKTDNLITTYMERSLHFDLKKKFCPDETMHEQKIGRFVADACDGRTIYEIQTGNLAPLEKKLKFYLENTNLDVVVVRPIAKKRVIYWLDKELGEFTRAPRTSPRREYITNGISDLFYVKDLLKSGRITFKFLLMEIDEIRLLDGYGVHKKIRATSVDRMAGEIFEEITIRSVDDIKAIILPLLPNEKFTRDDLSRALKLKALALWSAQKLLLELDILDCEKDGRKLIFWKK